MHITCRCLTKDRIDEALEEAKNNGITNLLCLRGDPPQGMSNYDPSNDYFQYAEDLVRYVREKYGDFFCICVAGYPGGHTESKSQEEDLYYLKRKVEAGADFVITQLFYDPDEFLEYETSCKKYEINVPILPGLLPIQNFRSFNKIINLCKINVPPGLKESLEEVKNDDEKVKELGIQNCVATCKKLMANGVKGIHYYTMNLEKSTYQTIKRLGIMVKSKLREMPWKKLNTPKRENETIRPIFWKNKSKSYLSKTWYWDEFPNGIWGDSRSPAFGNLTDHFVSFCKDYMSITDTPKKIKSLKTMWGEKVTSLKDVAQVFINYVDGKINKLPWCEEAELQSEIVLLKDLIINLNKCNIFTVNSQPAVNGKPSDDQTVGWGPSNGYVYQRMYVEFFIEKEKMDKLIKLIKNYPSIFYQAVSKDGEMIKEEDQQTVLALTWGVFPNREIAQPTIYDSEVFNVWKDEAFNLWNEWIRIYMNDEESCTESIDNLSKIRDEFYLMTIVDNDYVQPKAEEMFKEFFDS